MLVLVAYIKFTSNFMDHSMQFIFCIYKSWLKNNIMNTLFQIKMEPCMYFLLFIYILDDAVIRNVSLTLWSHQQA